MNKSKKSLTWSIDNNCVKPIGGVSKNTSQKTSRLVLWFIKQETLIQFTRGPSVLWRKECSCSDYDKKKASTFTEHLSFSAGLLSLIYCVLYHSRKITLNLNYYLGENRSFLCRRVIFNLDTNLWNHAVII